MEKKMAIVLNANEARIYTPLVGLIRDYLSASKFSEDEFAIMVYNHRLVADPSERVDDALTRWMKSETVGAFIARAAEADFSFFVPPDPKNADPSLAIASYIRLSGVVGRALLLIRVVGAYPISIVNLATQWTEFVAKTLL